MHAVVVRATIHDFEAGRRMLEEQVVPMVSQAPGFVAGYWTRGQDGNGMSMVVFESEEAAQGAAERLQGGLPDPDAVTLEGVEVREVVANA
jgi:hypothetical protein